MQPPQPNLRFPWVRSVFAMNNAGQLDRNRTNNDRANKSGTRTNPKIQFCPRYWEFRWVSLWLYANVISNRSPTVICDSEAGNTMDGALAWRAHVSDDDERFAIGHPIHAGTRMNAWAFGVIHVANSSPPCYEFIPCCTRDVVQFIIYLITYL